MLYFYRNAQCQKLMTVKRCRSVKANAYGETASYPKRFLQQNDGEPFVGGLLSNKPEQASTQLQPSLFCPRCGSSRLYKDGWRYTNKKEVNGLCLFKPERYRILYVILFQQLLNLQKLDSPRLSLVFAQANFSVKQI